MNFASTAILGLHIVEPRILEDERGDFYRTFCRSQYAAIRPDLDFVQMNQSLTRKAGTVRGLHYQVAPALEGKLVRCVRGSVRDVTVDLRRQSETFLRWVAIELSAENRRLLFIPEGCAHGFQTMCDDVEMVYCHTAYYTPEAECGIRYDDPRLSIDWPLPVTVSPKDSNLPTLPHDFQGV